MNLSAISKRASAIYEKQKKEWKEFCNKKGKSRTEVKKKAVEYRKKYGATPAKRWRTALKTAAKRVQDTQKRIF